MTIYPAILTAPRPQSTLLQTIGAMKRAGWPLVRVFDGTPPVGPTNPKGCTGGNIRLMEAVLDERPDAEALMIVEDDVLFSTGVREYLERTAWPAPPERIALISPYCPIAYSNHNKPYGVNGRWHREIRGLYLAGSQCWIYPMQQLPGIIEAIKKSEYGVDRAVGTYAEQAGLEVWYHTPSLCQHIGLGGNSAVGYVDCGEIYRSDTWPGEFFDARDFL